MNTNTDYKGIAGGIGWVYGYHIDENKIRTPEGVEWALIPGTLCRNTFCADKKGHCIYEGDILTDKKNLFVVEYRSGTFVMMLIGTNEGRELRGHSDEMVRIGNTHSQKKPGEVPSYECPLCGERMHIYSEVDIIGEEVGSVVFSCKDDFHSVEFGGEGTAEEVWGMWKKGLENTNEKL